MLNLIFLKVHLCVTSLTIDKFKLKNYIKLLKKKVSLHMQSACNDDSHGLLLLPSTNFIVGVINIFAFDLLT